MKKPVKLQNDDERTYPSTWDPNMWDPNMWGFELMRQWTDEAMDWRVLSNL